MTETTFASSPRQPPTDPTQAHPADVLLHLIVPLLARLFLPATNGDLAFARMAACETINQYCPRNHIDLIATAQIIAASLTALSSASLAAADNISLSMTLRLRANAVALNRVVEQARRALQVAQHDNSGLQKAFVPNPNQAQYKEQVLTELAAVQRRTAEALARYDCPEPAATQAPTRVPVPSPPNSAPAQIIPPIAPAPTAPAPTVRASMSTAAAPASTTPTPTGPPPNPR